MGKVTIVGINTASLPKLSHKQSQEILKKIKEGDESAREYFITCNLRLVLSLTQRYSTHLSNCDDLFQAGCIGLIRSVDNFDLSQNVRFSTYAVPMILGEIRRFLRESNSMRVSRGIRDVAYRALQTRDRLEKDSPESVSLNEIAKEMDLPVYQVLYCLDAISDTVSLQETVFSNDNDELCIEDQLSDSENAENTLTENICLKGALSNLSEREFEIISKRYYEGKTQMEVSKEVGLSQAQVSRIEKNAVSHLHYYMS